MEQPKWSVFDLTFLYMEQFTTETPTPETCQEYFRLFQDLISKGYVVEELLQILKQAKLKQQTINFNTFFKQYPMKRRNLLKQGVFYYHNELRITSPSPVVKYDIDSGELIRHVVPYFLELRASYDIDNLMDYFKSKTHCYEPQIMNDARLRGSFRWLTEQYDVELVLFMIDAAEIALSSQIITSLKNPSNVHEFHKEAKLSRDKKQNECKQVGGDCIVLKKRVFNR